MRFETGVAVVEHACLFVFIGKVEWVTERMKTIPGATS